MCDKESKFDGRFIRLIGTTIRPPKFVNSAAKRREATNTKLVRSSPNEPLGIKSLRIERQMVA